MAPRIQIVKIVALLLWQFGHLAALNFGVVTAYRSMELKRNLSLARRVRGFPDSRHCLPLSLLKSMWLILHLSFEICEKTNKILYSKTFLPMKSFLPLSGIHLVSWKTKSLRTSKLAFQSEIPF